MTRKTRRIWGWILISTGIVVALFFYFRESSLRTAPSVGVAARGGFPFEPGERLVYKGTWFFIPAGEAVLEVLPDASFNGHSAHHFVMSISTNSLIDLIYRIHERQDSYTDLEVTRTLQYRIKNTGDYPRDSVVFFDWRRMMATYVNFDKPERPVAIQPGTFDPLSLVFAIRMHRLIPGDVLEFPVCDGTSVIHTTAIVASRETVTIGRDAYDTLLVIPDLSRVENIWSGRGEPSLKIWLTSDERHLPVKVESRIAVGSFVFELVSANF
ncbi:MAG TPA: DUF3108 domain-containing protein [Syntrophales bacterium]|nr:DUF3108 domain-containing protein [Syntrophales bacterium]